MVFAIKAILLVAFGQHFKDRKTIVAFKKAYDLVRLIAHYYTLTVAFSFIILVLIQERCV